jgi:uncharacterized membrane protein YfcA
VLSADLLLAGAGVLAGLMGTAGGITSLVSYPALLWAGLPPLQATVANTIAIVACWPGSALASRPELAGRGGWVRRWGVVAAAGAAAGSLLLLSTPAGVFGRVVPFLIIAGSVVLLLQPRITTWSARAGRDAPAGRRPGRLLLPGGVAALSVYNGYFGAGAGMMLFALLLLTAEGRAAAANAMKNMLVGAAAIASAAIFAVLYPVDWTAVGPLAAGMLAGSIAGPWVARRLRPGVLRWLGAISGIAFAARLLTG